MSTIVPVSLADTIADMAQTDGSYAIAYALLAVARAQQATAASLMALGNGNADTPMGAIESLCVVLGAKLDALTEVLANSSTINPG